MSKKNKVKLYRVARRSPNIYKGFVDRFNLMLQSELANALRQIESHINLLVTLNGGLALPAMRGWPISPDFGSVIVNILDRTDYDLILEFGSGVSTFIIAALLCKPDSYPNLQSHIALEHLETFERQSLDWLARLHSTTRTQVWNCPLVSMKPDDGDGETYSYYDFQEKLLSHLQGLVQPVDRLLAIVDGPPGSLGHWSRYPAVPILASLLPHAELHVLLDDYNRSDESEIGQAWVHFLENHQYKVEIHAPPTEKGALFLKAKR